MNLNNYQKQCGLLQAQVGNIETWVWPQQDTQTFGIILHDWANGIRPCLLDIQRERKGTVIQAGGNCGLYPLLYTEFFESVYTFEPDPLSFYCLNNNCQLPNIHKFNCAIGHKPERVTMNEVDPNNRGMNKTLPVEGLGIPVVALDSFQFPDVRLIQLDLEGYEIPALLGAMETINKYKPPIMLECVVGYNYNEVMEVLGPIGYKMNRQISRLDMLFTWSE